VGIWFEEYFVTKVAGFIYYVFLDCVSR
jgi:hypothetical protein